MEHLLYLKAIVSSIFSLLTIVSCSICKAQSDEARRVKDIIEECWEMLGANG